MYAKFFIYKGRRILGLWKDRPAEFRTKYPDVRLFGTDVDDAIAKLNLRELQRLNSGEQIRTRCKLYNWS